MYWMLKYLGHPNVRVLDGGWVKWSAEMRRFECGPANPRPAIFKANVAPSLITNKAEVRKLVEASHPDTMLADARSTEEYNGAFQQGIARGGHIPSAVSVPWNQFFSPDGTVKPVEAIRAILEKHGTDRFHRLDGPVGAEELIPGNAHGGGDVAAPGDPLLERPIVLLGRPSVGQH